jgi:hypothetical protein
MSQIKQIQITFVPAEDRLLLRVSTSDDAEFRFWLSRRFVRLLWPVIGRLLAENPRIKTQPSPLAQRELLAFEHQKAVDAADFSTPYGEGEKALPLGEAPVLLTRFRVRKEKNDTPVLCMSSHGGQTVDLTLNPGLLHSVAELLQKAVAAAEWDLPPMIETQATAADAGKITVN